MECIRCCNELSLFIGEFAMGDEQTVLDSGEQTHITSTEQKNETTNNAQYVDDRSSRSEHLQAISNVLQRNEDEAGLCGGTFALDNEKRSSDLQLLNSEFHNFNAQTYTTGYKVPNKEGVPFGVEYIPSDGKLNIVMPVKFMGEANLDFPSLDYKIMSKEPTPQFKESYMSSVKRVWNQENSEKKYQLYLDAAKSDKNESCDSWAKLKPVEVNISVEDVSDREGEDGAEFYQIYFVPNSSFKTLDDALSFSNKTIAGKKMVVFTERAFDNRQADINGSGKQNAFAHEFGHQIGLGDEYAVNNFKIPEYTAKCDGKDIYPVYKEPVLEVYERTEYNRVYILSQKGGLFNHAGVYYNAEKMSFEGEKTGYVLKEADTKHELDAPLDEELGYCKAQTATDTDGKIHRAVYFFDRLLVGKKPGLRKYNLDKFYDNHTEIYHNSHRYMVKKGEDDNQKPFYYLVDVADKNGNMKKNFLDGMSSTHTKMVEEVFGEKDAWENASKFDSDELGDRASQFGNKDYLMNVGNNVMPHHYITFVYGMVAAIQKKYPDVPSQEAPNMEGDWIIR